MKHIAIDVRMICSSGIGKVIENVLKRMIPMKTEWYFSLLGKKKEVERFCFSHCPNVEIIECNSSIYTIFEQIELMRKIPQDIDLFWSPHYNVPLFYQGKLLVTIHDVFHLARPQFVNGIIKKVYAKFMFESAVKKANQIICVSQFTENELKKYTHVNEKKINVVYNGVDESWFRVEKKKDVHKNSYLLYVGNIKPHKNLHRLLAAYKKVKDNISQDLILVGKKDGFITGENAITPLVKELGDRVIFTGYVSDEKLQQYVMQADAMVFPSLYEGFGLPPLEAMACGCPVLVSNVASLPEVCGDGAIYCNPYDIDDIAKKILVRLKAKGEFSAKEIAEKYMWEICVEKMLRICENE